MFFTNIYNNFPSVDANIWFLIFFAVSVIIPVVIVFGFVLFKRLALKNIEKTVNKAGMAGFAYDKEQEIFYSETDAWQRRFGYCLLYDEAAPLLNMIIDVEPVRFRYGGKNWLIELWKGQYGMTTGAEIGIYYTRRPVSKKPPDRTFYKCVKDKDMLPVSIRLFKNNTELYSIKKRHWWLTGFVLGEFSRPNELRAVCGVTFPNYKMRDSFVQSLLNIGYDYDRFAVVGLTVRIIFSEPLSAQVSTRTQKREREAQAVNKALCELWDDVTDGIGDTRKKLEHVRKMNPELYKNAVAFGKTPNQYLSRRKRGIIL